MAPPINRENHQPAQEVHHAPHSKKSKKSQISECDPALITRTQETFQCIINSVQKAPPSSVAHKLIQKAAETRIALIKEDGPQELVKTLSLIGKTLDSEGKKSGASSPERNVHLVQKLSLLALQGLKQTNSYR
jgi:hypothetical protein